MSLPPSEPLLLAGHASVQRIGVFKFRNIGDVLLMTPAIRAVRRAFPRAKITVVVNSGTEAMLQGNPHLDEVLVYDRERRKGSLWGRLRYEATFFQQIWKCRFDLTINFASGERPGWCSLFSGAKWRTGYYNWWSKWNWQRLAYTQTYYYPEGKMHQVPWHLNLLQKLGIAPEGIVTTETEPLDLVLSEDVQQWAGRMVQSHGLKKYVQVHPVSRWLFKCWDDVRMAQVIDWLQEEKKLGVILTSGPEEREMERARRIIGLCRIKPVTFIGNLRLDQMGALMAKSDAFLGVDTAPMHMAAALRVPVVALFGPSGVQDWSPWGPKREILAKECFCGVQQKEGCDWNGVRACLLATSMSEVKAALERALAEGRD